MFLSRAFVLCLTASLIPAQPARLSKPGPPTRNVILNGKPVAYQAQGGHAVTQGDIILGSLEEIEAAASGKGPIPRAAAVVLGLNGQPWLWPDGVVYYSFAPGFPNQQRVLDAIEEWNRLTPIRLQLRTGQPDYIRFTSVSSPGLCQSYIGRIGGPQDIELGLSCPRAAVVHEIGHAIGMLHEQSRADRNRWITVLYENIDPANYNQYGVIETYTGDLGYYDYDSVMHYAPWGFSLDGNAAMETVPAGIPIGSRSGLSPADIDQMSRLYGTIPAQTTITTIPTGLPITVDGERFTSPRSFAWGPGSTHTISVDARNETGSAANPTRNEFVRWTDGGALSHTFTAGPSQTVVAAVFQQSFRVLSSVLGGNGTVTLEPPSPDGYYLSGSKIRVTAKPAGSDRFYRWQGTNPEIFGYGLAAEVLDLEVRGFMNFPAQFSSQFMTTVDSKPQTREVTIDGTPYYTPVRFLSFTPGTSHTMSLLTQQYDWTEAFRWNFSGWEDGSLSAARTVVIPETAPTYSPNFSRQFYLDLSWNNGGSVTANPFPAEPYFDAGSRVTLTAIPRGNSALQYWLGDVASGGPVQNIVMDRAKYLFAVFGSALNFRATNAASYLSTPMFDSPGLAVTPLEIVTLLGSGLGPDTLANGTLDANGRLSTLVGNTRVLFDGVPAPIVYASANQTSVIVPAEVAGKVFTVISIERGGVVNNVGTASIAAALPGLFTANASGTGVVAALNQDGSFHSQQPASPGSVITLFASGAGLMDRTLPNGAVTGADLGRPLQPVSVRIGTQVAEVLYAGSAPSLVHGVLQINVRIPPGTLSGEHSIKLVVGNYTSPPGTTVSVR